MDNHSKPVAGRKVVVIGSAGRLGSSVAKHLENRGCCVTGLTRENLDLSDAGRVAEVLGALDFDTVFLSAALTHVDYCETARKEAFATNAEAPAAAAAVCVKKGARLIHVGTDYVYAGDDATPRHEDDPTVPASIYGESKLAGDQAVVAADPRFLVLRTSWVFGPGRPSFLDFMIERAREHENVVAISDKVSTPCYALDFADMLDPLLTLPDIGGIVNLCNTGSCNWQEYAQHGVDCARRFGVPVKSPTIGSTKLADFANFVAKRPVHTAMSTDKYARLTGLQPRSWQDAVEAFVRDYVAPAALRGAR